MGSFDKTNGRVSPKQKHWEIDSLHFKQWKIF